jgi:hypothetical protein
MPFVLSAEGPFAGFMSVSTGPGWSIAHLNAPDRVKPARRLYAGDTRGGNPKEKIPDTFTSAAERPAVPDLQLQSRPGDSAGGPLL